MSRNKHFLFTTMLTVSAHTLQYLENTILDKNVKKNAPCMFNFRILPSKAQFSQDTPPQKKTMLKGEQNIFAPDLTTLTREG